MAQVCCTVPASAAICFPVPMPLDFTKPAHTEDPACSYATGNGLKPILWHRAQDPLWAIPLAPSSLGPELCRICLPVAPVSRPAGCQSCALSWACPPIRSCQKKPPTCFCVQHCWRHPQLSAGSSTKQQWQHWITWSRRHQQQHQHPERVAAAWLLWRQQQSHRPRAAWICQVSSQGLLQQELSTRRECHGSRCPTLCCRSYGQVSGAQW
jgi:hypothetical protein